MNPMAVALVLAVAPAGAATSAATEKEPPEPVAIREAWEYRSGLSAAFVREQDPGGDNDLSGYRLAFTALARGTSSRFVGNLYVEWKESPVQEVLEAGASLAFPYWQKGRFGIGPRLRLAVQDRAEAPHRGTDAVLGAGLQVGLQVSHLLRLTAHWDRATGLEAGARTAYSLGLNILLWKD